MKSCKVVNKFAKRLRRFGQYEYRSRKPKGEGWEQTPNGKTWRRKKGGGSAKKTATKKPISTKQSGIEQALKEGLFSQSPSRSTSQSGIEKALSEGLFSNPARVPPEIQQQVDRPLQPVQVPKNPEHRKLQEEVKQVVANPDSESDGDRYGLFKDALKAGVDAVMSGVWYGSLFYLLHQLAETFLTKFAERRPGVRYFDGNYEYHYGKKPPNDGRNWEKTKRGWRTADKPKGKAKLPGKVKGKIHGIGAKIAGDVHGKRTKALGKLNARHAELVKHEKIAKQLNAKIKDVTKANNMHTQAIRMKQRRMDASPTVQRHELSNQIAAHLDHLKAGKERLAKLQGSLDKHKPKLQEAKRAYDFIQKRFDARMGSNVGRVLDSAYRGLGDAAGLVFGNVHKVLENLAMDSTNPHAAIARLVATAVTHAVSKTFPKLSKGIKGSLPYKAATAPFKALDYVASKTGLFAEDADPAAKTIEVLEQLNKLVGGVLPIPSLEEVQAMMAQDQQPATV